MTDAPTMLFYLLLLILPITALIARRVQGATVIRYAAVWIAIFVIGMAVLIAIQ